MIDFKSLAYATLGVLLFVVDILFKKLFVVVEHYFIVQKVFQLFCVEFVVFKVEIVSVEFVSLGLIAWVMELRQEGVLKCFLYCYSLCWVYNQHLFEQVNCSWVVLCKQLVECLNFRFIIQVLYNVQLVTVKHLLDLLLCFFTQHLYNHFYLFNFIVAWKQRLTQEHLCKYTPSSPHVYCCRILFPRDHHFRCPIPSSSYVVSKNCRGALLLYIVTENLSSCKTKVTYL